MMTEEQTNLGETPEERRLIEELWHNIWVSRASLDAMQTALNRGEYARFLEFAAAMSLGWMVVGDSMFEKLLSEREKRELTSREAQSDLESLVLRYMQELNSSDN